MIGDLYGRKLGLLRLAVSQVFDLVGVYKSYHHVRFADVERVVFVCSGNICRSAYAEARARRVGLSAVSAGLNAERGRMADPNAMRFAAERSVDLSAHRTTPMADLSLGENDLVVCMEPGHAVAIRKMTPHARSQITLLGLWAGQCRPYLQDPYGLTEGYWRTCFSVIDSAVERIARGIPTNSAHNARAVASPKK